MSLTFSPHSSRLAQRALEVQDGAHPHTREELPLQLRRKEAAGGVQWAQQPEDGDADAGGAEQ